MGAIGTGPFDDDAAAEALGEALDAPGQTLRRLLLDARGSYVEAVVGAGAWAAAETVALSFGRGVVHEAPGWVAEILLRLKPSESLRTVALRAVERLGADGSELAELWNETEHAAEHRARLDDLKARLEAAASGAIPIPRPKRGDVVLLRCGELRFAVQVVASHEVVVFEGSADAVDPSAIASLLTRRGHRVSTFASVPFSGEILGRAKLPRVFRGNKHYAYVGHRLASYWVGPSRSSYDDVPFETARDHELHHVYALEELAKIVRGAWEPPRLPSPEERLESLRSDRNDAWAKHRAATSPHSFGDRRALDGVLWAMQDIGGSGREVVRQRDAARAHAGDRGPSHLESDARHYAFAGIIARWTDDWGRDAWPADLSVPSIDRPDLLPDAVEAARHWARYLRLPNVELRQIWEAGADGGEAFDRCLDDLDAALGRAALRYPPREREMPRA